MAEESGSRGVTAGRSVGAGLCGDGAPSSGGSERTSIRVLAQAEGVCSDTDGISGWIRWSMRARALGVQTLAQSRNGPSAPPRGEFGRSCHLHSLRRMGTLDSYEGLRTLEELAETTKAGLAETTKFG